MKYRTKLSLKYLLMGLLSLLIIPIPFITLYNTGKLKKGNKKIYNLDDVVTNENSPLTSKTIAFLGSSVTYGTQSGGVSFVEYLAKRNNFNYIKEAVGGTTLVTTYKNSYIERLEKMDKNIKADTFVVQLSTNDATRKLPLGEISKDNNYNKETVIGAIEYIISYIKDNYNCPIIFYTGTKYESKNYEDMVNALKEISKKWDIGIIDLWNDEDMHKVNEKDYNLYMSDPIHPTKAGYKLWWTPKMEKYLINYIK